MKKTIFILLVVLISAQISYAEIKINCYSETGKFLGNTRLKPGTDVALVYNPSGYYIGHIDLKNEDFLYYDTKGILKAKVHINTSLAKAIFYFWLNDEQN